MNEIAMLLAAGKAPKTMIEDVFSINTYRGSESAVTVKSGVNVAGHDALIWTKDAKDWDNHNLRVKSLGLINGLASNLSDASTAFTSALTANADGHTVGAGDSSVNYPDALHCAWTFRKAPRFFDIVQYSGNGTARSIAHSLGVDPGMIFIKRLNGVSDWIVYHKDIYGHGSYGDFVRLNQSGPSVPGTTMFSALATSSVFNLNTDASVNGVGSDYVALVFAHDASDDGLIQCGLSTAAGESLVVTLPWEPQYVLYKRVDAAGDWMIIDSKRGAGVGSGIAWNISPNKGDAGVNNRVSGLYDTAFAASNTTGASCIWMAIRRGPMRQINDATKLFDTVLYNGSSGSLDVASPTIKDVDLAIWFNRNFNYPRAIFDRKRGEGASFDPASTDNQSVEDWSLTMDLDGGMRAPSTWYNVTGEQNGIWMFKRAPGFLDSVFFLGTGSTRSVPHKLGAAPQLWLVKQISGTAGSGNGNWRWGYAANPGMVLPFNGGGASDTTVWNNTAPSDTHLHLGGSVANVSGNSYIAHLFGNLAGVSRVGTIAAANADQSVPCGFAGSARFVLITIIGANTWPAHDVVRGMTEALTRRIDIGMSVAEVTNGLVKPFTGGFTLKGIGGDVTGINFLYLAIA